MRDVEAGEELTLDYAMMDDCDGEMACNCGTAACRKIVTGQDWRRPELQQKYRGYFSIYLQKRIADSGPREARRGVLRAAAARLGPAG